MSADETNNTMPSFHMNRPEWMDSSIQNAGAVLRQHMRRQLETVLREFPPLTTPRPLETVNVIGMLPDRPPVRNIDIGFIAECIFCGNQAEKSGQLHRCEPCGWQMLWPPRGVNIDNLVPAGLFKDEEENNGGE